MLITLGLCPNSRQDFISFPLALSRESRENLRGSREPNSVPWGRKARTKENCDFCAPTPSLSSKAELTLLSCTTLTLYWVKSSELSPNSPSVSNLKPSLGSNLPVFYLYLPCKHIFIVGILFMQKVSSTCNNNFYSLISLCFPSLIVPPPLVPPSGANCLIVSWALCYIAASH